MKRLAIIFMLCAMLFVGCAQQLPQTDDSDDNAQGVEAPSEDDANGESEHAQESETTETVYATPVPESYSFQQVKVDVSVTEPRFKIFIPCDTSVISPDPQLDWVNVYGALKDFTKKGIYVRANGVEVELEVPSFPLYKSLVSPVDADETASGFIRITEEADEEDEETGEVTHIEDTYTIEAELSVSFPNVEVKDVNIGDDTVEITIDVKNDKIADGFSIENNVALEGSFADMEIVSGTYDENSLTLSMKGKLGASNEGRVRLANGSLYTGYGAVAVVDTSTAPAIYSPVLVNGSGDIRIYAVGMVFPSKISASDFKLSKGKVTGAARISNQLVRLTVSGVSEDAVLTYEDYSCTVSYGSASAGTSALTANANDIKDVKKDTDLSWAPLTGELSQAAAECMGKDVYEVYCRMLSGSETEDDKALILSELKSAILRIQNSAATLPYSNTLFMKAFKNIESTIKSSPEDALSAASKTYAGYDAAELQMKILDGYFPFEHQGQKYLEYSARYFILAMMNAGYADGAAFSGMAELFGLEKDSPRYVQTENEALYSTDLPCGEGYALISNADKKLYLIKKNWTKMNRTMFNLRTAGYVTEYFKYLFPQTEVEVQGKSLKMITDTDQLAGLMCRLDPEYTSLNALTEAGYDFLYGSKYLLLNPFAGQDYKYGYDVGGKGYVYDFNITITRIKDFSETITYPVNEYFVDAVYKGAQNEEQRTQQRSLRQSYKCLWVYVQSEVADK